MFDLSIGKLLVLAVIAIVVFGPEQLPKLAAQAGRTLRELRKMTDGATKDLRQGLGPEFADFDVTDLHPRNFVRKHLLDGYDDEPDDGVEPLATEHVPALAFGETPPYDSEAT
ncbi:MAG TPA: sec-independent translocase [Streptosporangiaceae bacterium]|jgi:sec-independent protein translocase protein TatB|nr:sec-independent translocase [Streptosporangiaceae bacterium]